MIEIRNFFPYFTKALTQLIIGIIAAAVVWYLCLFHIFILNFQSSEFHHYIKWKQKFGWFSTFISFKDKTRSRKSLIWISSLWNHVDWSITYCWMLLSFLILCLSFPMNNFSFFYGFDIWINGKLFFLQFNRKSKQRLLMHSLVERLFKKFKNSSTVCPLFFL